MAEKRVVLFDKKNITKRLREENQFVMNICRAIPGLYSSEPIPKAAAVNRKPGPVSGTEKRPTSLEVLQRRLQEWKGKSVGVGVKKVVKNKILKHKKKVARKAKKAGIKGNKKPPLPKKDIKPLSEPTVTDSKPAVTDSKPDRHPLSGPKSNEYMDVVYNKFDHYEFLADEKQSEKKPKKKKNPRKLLAELEKKNKELERLKTDNEEEYKLKKNELAWKTALDRVQGIKVRDDVKKLKKSIKNKERLKRKSQREWAERVQQVEMKKKQRQEVRTANIEARQKQKKTKKMKRLVKRGRLIPGYSKFS